MNECEWIEGWMVRRGKCTTKTFLTHVRHVLDELFFNAQKETKFEIKPFDVPKIHTVYKYLKLFCVVFLFLSQKEHTY